MHRSFLLVVLAGTSLACSPQDLGAEPVEPEGLTWESSTDQLPPPGAALTLSVGQISAGLPVAIQIGNADPGESSIFLLRSTSGMDNGPCPGIMGGACVDLAVPLSPSGPLTASASGTVSLSPSVPPVVPFGTNVCFQAVAIRGAAGVDTVKSETICRVTNNGPVSVEYSANNGPIYNDASSMGGPGLLFAIRHDAAVQGVVGYAEIFTGEEAGLNEIAIWSHDTTADQPLAPIASGTWMQTAANEWQGADLGARVPMIPGETYWVVWSPVQTAQSTFDLSGASVAYRGSFDGGGTWNGPFTANLKYRLCGGGGCP